MWQKRGSFFQLSCFGTGVSKTKVSFCFETEVVDQKVAKKVASFQVSCFGTSVSKTKVAFFFGPGVV
jgi:hypothetical protein